MNAKYLAFTAAALALAGAVPSLAQAASPKSADLKLGVVLSRYQEDVKVGSEAFQLLLPPGVTGTVRIGAAPKAAPPAGASASCVAAIPSTDQGVRTQVESTVAPTADGSFSVSLTITERAFAGCRLVGNREIPVFSNRIIAQVVTLKSGETTEVPMSFDNVRKTGTKIEVSLATAEK